VQQGFAVSYLNPKQIHQFAQMKLHYNKTDKQDAKLIVEYCKLFKPSLYQPQDALRQQLLQRSRRLDQRQKMHQQEVNRFQSGINDPFTQDQIQMTITYFDTLIEHTKQAIEQLIKRDQQLTQQHRLLVSIKGIGDKTASLILAEININNFDSARQLVAYIGITPQ
jgi:transposase